ncbi:MAG: phosphatase PAP2 family protein [Candidatus Lokiarchaeota archaeon]|nr:phosphatase PAP2 family protein [Candidatus Lokiarchaeota archaeon]
MSEKKEFISKKGLMVISIVSLAILIIGIILYYFNLNEAFYSSSDSVQSIFKAITYLGEPVVFIIIIAILFLIYNKTYAKSLAYSLLFSYYLNGLFKEVFQDLRPATNVPGSDHGFIEPDYGFPSGHAQTAVSFWGHVGYEFNDRYEYKNIQIVPIIISILIFLIAISRIIIGVHDLQDIIGGLMLGIGFLLLFIYIEPYLTEQFNKLNFLTKIIVTASIGIFLFLLGTLLFPSAGLGLVGPPSLFFKDDGVFAQVGGSVLGFGIGYLLEQEYVKYDPTYLTTKKKLINLALGIIILLVVFVPFEYLIKIDSVVYRFFRYALPTFILAYIVPLICTKIDPKI